MEITNWPYELKMGHADDPSTGACAMAAVNWLVHGIHGDQPVCASPVIGAFVRSANDLMDDQRQLLVPFLHRIAGSKSDRDERKRARILVGRTVRRSLSGAFRHLAPVDLSEAALKLSRLSENAGKVAILRCLASVYAQVSEAPMNTKTRGIAIRLLHEAKAAARLLPIVLGNPADAADEAAWCMGSCAVISGNWHEGWQECLEALDAALRAGPQGEPWSADQVVDATMKFERAKTPQLA